jgi:hypothetical protein
LSSTGWTFAPSLLPVSRRFQAARQVLSLSAVQQYTTGPDARFELLVNESAKDSVLVETPYHPSQANSTCTAEVLQQWFESDGC